MDDIEKLLEKFPKEISNEVQDVEGLIEIVLDLGRPLELRYTNDEYEIVEDLIINRNHLNEILNQLGDFGPDNRAGVDSTLHRISRIVNRVNKTVGLTCRVGKPFYGSVALIEDLIAEGRSVLLLGAPGAGKTTLLRDVSRHLSTTLRKRVVIVDTSNEIAGDGDISHPAVGQSRRMQVPFGRSQHEVMVEAVENHMPQVIVIDEIGTQQEAMAARTISQRGVQLIATAHGKYLEDLLWNPPLCDLIGGINVVTLSDMEAKQRGTAKTVQERKTEPTFNTVVEMVHYDVVKVHKDVPSSVDSILSGGKVKPEERRILGGEMKIVSLPKIVLPQQGHGVFTRKRR